MRCFSRLIYNVDYSVCLHYFIPENNMFENKIEGRTREILLEKLNNLHSYGWRCILFSDQVSNFHVSMYNINIEPYILHTSAVEKTLNSLLLLLMSFGVIDQSELKWNAYNRGINQIVSCDKSFVYYMSMMGASFAWSLSLDNTKSNNKHQYKQYKSCLCTLLQHIHHDAVSGWLMLASFFYKSKQYSNALHIIAYSISKCTPEKIHRFMDISDIHVRLPDLQVFKRKSILQMWKIILVDFMIFRKSSWLIPYELQMEVENNHYCISSIVYAYFLKILCHYHLHNVRQCQDCLHTLQLVIAENYFIENNRAFLSIAYTVLGIASQLLGHIEPARQAFMQ
ncbi:uncharacterized protein LOC127716192 [Mytilus californianus]|uniref:uncharacterized protein LOC127716192 n=1 Tax=Mytilus californianus TaxID=6549 RepID=UPI002247ED4B|nr:uncharacterized protein LOC127716192 [Mytilus californianus]